MRKRNMRLAMKQDKGTYDFASVTGFADPTMQQGSRIDAFKEE